MTQNPLEGFETVIGLEVHVQLRTATKIFCRCENRFGSEPNTHVCPVCLGLPGALPVLNQQAVEFAIRLGLATHCSIAPRSVFARKNYFYPDLPKGYQISQYELPLCERGFIDIDTPDIKDNPPPKRIHITRIHMEEDAGKLIHATDGSSWVDLNRASVPLLEIVSEPDMRNTREAGAYMREIHRIIRYLDISDGNMEEGSLRCDANISLRPIGQEKFGTKVELKNINSFRFVEKSLEFEQLRQAQVLREGGTINQETRLYDSDKNTTRPMRSKEFAHDYRYFPDPDLLPLLVDEAWINRCRGILPELGREKRNRFIEQYKLPFYDADVLTQESQTADYFEQTIAALVKKSGSSDPATKAKLASNWVMGDILRIIKEEKLTINQLKIKPQTLASLIAMILDNRISGKIAKDVFNLMQESGEEAESIVKRQGLEQVSDSGAIETKISEVLNLFPNEVAQFKGGKTKLMGFFVGQVMKVTQGKANPQMVNDLLTKLLK